MRTTLLIPLLVSHGYALHLAQPAVQLEKRAAYLGGWALGAVTCPADAPVICNEGSSSINTNCCPSGNTCFGFLSPYCCPTNSDCHTQVSNLPVCASSDWNMYILSKSSVSYFCCKNDQIGLLPQKGYAGICAAKDQAVPATQLATLASQIGGGPATAAGSSPSNTAASAAGVTTKGAPAATGTPDGNSSGSSSTGVSSSLSPPPSSPASSSSAIPSNSTSGVQLGTGAIAGIAVGAALVISMIIFVSWRCWATKQKQLAFQHQNNPPTNPVYPSPPLPHTAMSQPQYAPPPVDSPVSSAAQATPQYKEPAVAAPYYSPASEIHGNPSPQVRHEMGPSG